MVLYEYKIVLFVEDCIMIRVCIRYARSFHDVPKEPTIYPTESENTYRRKKNRQLRTTQDDDELQQYSIGFSYGYYNSTIYYIYCIS